MSEAQRQSARLCGQALCWDRAGHTVPVPTVRGSSPHCLISTTIISANGPKVNREFGGAGGTGIEPDAQSAQYAYQAAPITRRGSPPRQSHLSTERAEMQGGPTS